jgi:hypothetical protein
MRFYLKIFLCLIVSIFSLHFVINNDYRKEHKERCIVLGKIQTSAGFRQSAEFYLILRNSENIVFDLKVSPSIYVTSNKNDILYFNLMKCEIIQDEKQEILIILFSIIGAFSFSYMIGSILVEK